MSRGDCAGMAALAGEKQAMLQTLEDLIRRISGEGPGHRDSRPELPIALAARVDDSRRNEGLIRAARQRVAAARRRIDAIMATKRGAAAYDRDGAPISPREDAASESSRA